MAKKLVLECLDAVSTNTIRRDFNLTWQYLDAYRYVLCLVNAPQVLHPTNCSKGLMIRQAEFAVKKYSSHSRIPGRVVMDLAIMDL